MAVIYVALALLATVVAAQNEVECDTSNDCAGSKRTHCLEGVCRQCERDCDCAVDQYCVSDERSEERYTCKGYGGDRLGKYCDPTITNPFAQVRLGENDLFFCGLLVFNETSSEVLTEEWRGNCFENKCEVCADNLRYSCSKICVGGEFIRESYNDRTIATAKNNPIAMFAILAATTVGVMVLAQIVILVRSFV